jgi:hypothetical protein
MRAANALALFLLLGGCTVTALAKSAPLATPPPIAPSAPATMPTAEFAALVDHVGKRATLWREGAPINSLVLDARQTVLNPVAIGCARRDPLVIIDADPASGSAPATPATAAAWQETTTAIRAAGVNILWISDRVDAGTLASALIPAGFRSTDLIATLSGPSDRKQLLRQRWAASHCILAVVGDTRGDADEAYDYLRSADTVLPIDGNWGAGWFLLPAPLANVGAD